MKKVMMTKYGFVRTPEEDFADDSSRFTCYKVGRVRVTKCVSDGEAYIDGDIRDGKLPYEVYSKLPHYKDIGELNGVSVASLEDRDLQRLYDSCVAYEKEYADAENSIKYPSLDEIREQCKKLCAKRLVELGTVEDLMRDHGFEAAAKLSAYEWKTLQEYIKNLMGKVKQYNPETYPQSILGQAYSFNFVRPDNSDFKDCFYYTYIIEMFQKHSII